VSSSQLLSALAGAGTRRPRLVIAIAAVLGLGAAGLALRLRPTAATNTFVSSSSSEYRATQRLYRGFGEEPIVVLVKGNLQQLVLSSDIERLAGLEGCLSGNVPAAALAAEGGTDGPCGELARAKTVKVVFGPGTFLNEAATQIDAQLTAEGKRAEAQAKQAESTVLHAALARGRRRARLRSRASSRASSRRRSNTGLARSRASKTPTSSRAWCSIRASQPALPSRASPTYSQVATRRSCRCG